MHLVLKWIRASSLGPYCTDRIDLNICGMAHCTVFNGWSTCINADGTNCLSAPMLTSVNAATAVVLATSFLPAERVLIVISALLLVLHPFSLVISTLYWAWASEVVWCVIPEINIYTTKVTTVYFQKSDYMHFVKLFATWVENGCI